MKKNIIQLKSFKIFLLVNILLTGNVYSQSGWTIQNVSPNYYNYRSIHFSPNGTGYTLSSNGVVAKTTNYGQTWNPNYSSVSGDKYSIAFINENTGYIIGVGPTLAKTTNGALNWNLNNIVSYSSFFLNIKFIDSITCFASGNGYAFNDSENDTSWIDSGFIIKSTNSGLNWTTKVLDNYVWVYSLNFINSMTGFAAGGLWLGNARIGLVYKTIDGGLNYSRTYIDDNYFKSIFFVDENTGWVVGNYGKIYKTSNSGTNWIQQQSNFNSTLNSIYFINDQTGWAVGFNGIILYTSNGGDAWSFQESGITSELNQVTFINDYTGWICSSNRVVLFTTSGGLTNINNIFTNIPEAFFLYQNYPNPFNPETNLKFSIPQSGFVSLVVYDISGREVVNLVNEKLNSGTYDYNFNGVGLSSGVYFYRLHATDFVETRKMILLR